MGCNSKIKTYMLITFTILILMGIFSVVPVMSLESAKKIITVTKVWENDSDAERPTDITINLKKTSSILKIGADVRSTLVYVAGNNTNIKKFLKASKVRYEAAGSPISNNIALSGEPVYIWYDNETIYYYSTADNIYMNENSSSMFTELPNLSDISGLSGFNTAYVTNMFKLFTNDYSLVDLSPLSNWDVGNVTSMRLTFGSNYTGPTGNVSPMSITNLAPLSGWNTQKVTDMGLMFKGCLQLSDISPLASWNVSNLANTNQMFMRCGISDATCIKDWDVVRVGGLFINANTGANTTGNFDQMFTHQNDIINSQPTLVPFTERNGSWNNGTYSAYTGAATGSAPTTTKVNDANQYTSSSPNCTITKNGNIWTYEFEVSNDESSWKVWETTNDGKLDDKNGNPNEYQESSGGTNGLGGSESNAITGIGIGGNNSATITNSLGDKYDITINNLITGNMSSAQDEFEYTIILYDKNDNPLSGNISINSSENVILTNGSFTRTLNGNESLVINDITDGYKYKIIQQAPDYSQSYTIKEDNVISNPVESNETSLQILSNDNIVTFTNNKEEAVKTGTISDIFPLILLLFVGILGLITIKSIKKYTQ